MKISKQERKRILAELRDRERAAAIAALPAELALLQEWLDLVDQDLEEAPCRDDLTLSRATAEELGLDFAKLEPWVQEHGGYCDCEVVANVGGHVDEVADWLRPRPDPKG